ncbi:MAG: PAS-domain containing protein [Pelagimonas sp.]|jgi:signal transduction histidine kinase/CheY-like chemotaxis protein|nr:PAS-domain containing protein [Pelagimonas sp.]
MSNLTLTHAGLNLIQQALSIFDSDLRLVLSNTPMQEMFDLPGGLMKPGVHFNAFIKYLAERGDYGPIDDIDGFVRDRTELAKAFEPHYMERTRANGRTIAVEGAPMPGGGWVTVYTDITETKTQEQLLRARSEHLSEEVIKHAEQLSATNRKLAATNHALQETRRQLVELEARARTTTEMTPAHIARVDAEGHYTFSNKQLNSVMPGRPTELIGLHVSQALGPQAYSRVKPHLEKALRGQQSRLEFTDEMSSRRIRGVFTPDPVDPGAYILSLDVTEETQARAALQQTRRREMAAQLTSGMAHDFANLLTIILGMQSRLQRMGLPDTAQELINATLQAARRGGTMLDKISDITSPRRWNPEPVDLAPFMADLQTLATPTLPRDVALRVDTLTKGRFLLDSGLVQDALLNLILNARDACAGKGEIQISVQEVKGTWLQFTAQDSGKGFSDEALERGLDPFFTTKGGEGSGLGLAMVYDMTKLAGGSVRLDNNEIGACITLRFPLRRATNLPSSGLVLLVEDSPELRDLFRGMLTDMGYSVVEAASVTEASQLINSLPEIALILSDIKLEGEETGLNLLDCRKALPVLLMTSLPLDHPLHVEARNRTTVLPKPFGADQLARFLGQET